MTREEQIEQMIDREAISKLKFRYFRACDTLDIRRYSLYSPTIATLTSGPVRVLILMD